MKLISNTFFGKQLTEKYLNGFNNLTYYQRIRSYYDNFLSQPLELWMFVPCDENDNVLEEPKEDNSKYWNKGVDGEFNHNKFIDEKIQYLQAKERVLFEGFKLIENSKLIKIVRQNGDINKSVGFGFSKVKERTIESLVFMDLTLTPNAIKQLKL